MFRKSWRSRCSTGCAGLLLLGGVASAQDAPPEAPPPTSSTELSAVIRQSMREQDARIAAMRDQLAAQNAQIEAMKRELASQQADYRALRRAVGLDTLEQQRAGNIRAGGPGASALPMMPR